MELEPFGPETVPVVTREESLATLTDAQLDALERGEQVAPEVPSAGVSQEIPAPSATPEAAASNGEPSETVESLDQEILRLSLEEARAENSRLNSLVGAHGGEIGYLRKQVKALEDRPSAAPAAPEADPYQDDQPAASALPSPAAPAPQRRSDPVTTYAVGQAVQSATSAFTQQHLDIFQHDADGKVVQNGGQWLLEPDFQTALTEAQGKLSSILDTDDPMYAGQASQQVLETAYWKFTRNRAVTRRTELERRRADMAGKLKADKRAAAVTGSAGPPLATPEPKTLSQMPTEELDKILDREFGGT